MYDHTYSQDSLPFFFIKKRKVRRYEGIKDVHDELLKASPCWLANLASLHLICNLFLVQGELFSKAISAIVPSLVHVFIRAQTSFMDVVKVGT